MVQRLGKCYYPCATVNGKLPCVYIIEEREIERERERERRERERERERERCVCVCIVCVFIICSVYVCE